jgi:hypothetical protein
MQCQVHHFLVVVTTPHLLAVQQREMIAQDFIIAWIGCHGIDNPTNECALY